VEVKSQMDRPSCNPLRGSCMSTTFAQDGRLVLRSAARTATPLKRVTIARAETTAAAEAPALRERTLR
jgi:hypothetical protein